MRLISWLLRLLVLVLLLAGIHSMWSGFRSGTWLPGWMTGTDETQAMHTVVLQEISSMGKLELVKYNFKDVVDRS
jgi:hypothetical protein